MTSRQLLITLIFLVGLGILFTAGRLLIARPQLSPTPSPVVTNAVCTLEAKICPDGSAVGRVGPNCEFAECPSANSASSTATFTLSIGAKSGTNSLSVRPQSVVEDSRCAVGVVCIQAGTVRVQAEVTAGNSIPKQEILGLNKPLEIGGKTLTLVGVKPDKHAGEQIAPSSYLFTFSVK
jgi:hypothetical protein